MKEVEVEIHDYDEVLDWLEDWSNKLYHRINERSKK